MQDTILLKLGELVLKGLNRHTFEEQLMSNARRRLKAYGEFKVYTRQSITYVEPKNDDCDMAGAYQAMKKVWKARSGRSRCMDSREIQGKTRSTPLMHRAQAMSSRKSLRWGL